MTGRCKDGRVRKNKRNYLLGSGFVEEITPYLYFGI